MIVDTSAIMAILLREDEADEFLIKLFEYPDSRISAGTWIELSAIITRRRQPGILDDLESLIRHIRLRITPVSVRQAELGHEAYRSFGRGSGHGARLNFGDCFAYALAKDTGEPLLYKGNDFAKTDIAPAL